MVAAAVSFFASAAFGAGGGGVEVEGADAEGEGDVLGGVGLGGEAFGEIVDPGVEVVDPGFDGEVPEAELGGVVGWSRRGRWRSSDRC